MRCHPTCSWPAHTDPQSPRSWVSYPRTACRHRHHLRPITLPPPTPPRVSVVRRSPHPRRPPAVRPAARRCPGTRRFGRHTRDETRPPQRGAEPSTPAFRAGLRPAPRDDPREDATPRQQRVTARHGASAARHGAGRAVILGWTAPHGPGGRLGQAGHEARLQAPGLKLLPAGCPGRNVADLARRQQPDSDARPERGCFRRAACACARARG